MATDVSHGRGGAGNMTPDNRKYVDGEIVRVGTEGSHGDGAFSSGRGGGGNIVDRNTPTTERNDRDLIPDAAVRDGADAENRLVGRGGAGNARTKSSGSADAAALSTNHQESAGSSSSQQQEQPQPQQHNHHPAHEIDRDRRMFEEYRASNPERPVRGLADKLKDMLFGRKRR